VKSLFLVGTALLLLTSCYGGGENRDGVAVVNLDGSGDTEIYSQAADSDIVWSPDGRRVAFVDYDTDAGTRKIIVENADGRYEVEIASEARSFSDAISREPFSYRDSPSWSPDGLRIAFSLREGLYIADVDGNGLFKLASEQGGQPSWSPDGSTIVFTAGRRIWTVKVDGTGLRPLTDFGQFRLPRWSPDGTMIAFTSYGSEYDIYLVNRDGTGLTNLTNTPTRHELGFTWSPNGHEIAYVATTWLRSPSGSETPESLGLVVVDTQARTTRTLVEATGSWGVAAGESAPSWSPDATEIAFVDRSGDIRVINVRSGKDRRLVNGYSPAWSPTSGKIAYKRYDTEGSVL
jgi:Tol biopolymer transport system component